MAKKFAEDIEEIKKSLNYMSDELNKMVKKQDLMSLIDEVRQLKTVIQEKDKRIEELERRVEDLEQYTRMDDVVVTGLVTTHQNYARVTAGSKEGEDAPPGELLSLEHQVIKFFNNKDIPLDGKNIGVCYTIPQKQNIPKIIIRFTNRKQKIELLKLTKKLRGTGVYVNEHLTKRNAEIARQARILKKEKRIQDTWTRNCKVMIKLNGTPEQAKIITIREIKDLDRFK